MPVFKNPRAIHTTYNSDYKIPANYISGFNRNVTSYILYKIPNKIPTGFNEKKGECFFFKSAHMACPK